MGATSKQPKFPSPAGQRVLLNLAAGRDGAFGLSGMSASGGYVRTMLALRNAGLVSPAPAKALTEAGQTMAARLQSNNKLCDATDILKAKIDAGQGKHAAAYWATDPAFIYPQR